MKRIPQVVLLLAAVASQSFAQQSEFAAGRASYQAGEFKKAVAHFQLALQNNPNDGACHYWLGKSYETLADIGQPFSGSYNARARVYLTRAVELAPTRTEYRQELFAFLLDSADSSVSALRQAKSVLRAVPESDPEYADMQQRFDQSAREHANVAARLSQLFLAAPQAASRLPEVITSPRPATSSVTTAR